MKLRAKKNGASLVGPRRFFVDKTYCKTSMTPSALMLT